MLTILRKKKVAKRILWALAIIIIPAFVLWGVESLSKRKFAAGSVGTIYGKKISSAEFTESVHDMEIGLFLSYFNQPQVLDKLQKDRKLLNRLGWENLIVKINAKKDKIGVSDKEVVAFVTRHPLFARGGVFDNKLYDYILRNSLGLTARSFEENVRNFLVTAKYKDEIVRNVSVSDEELRESYKNESEKAKIRYVVIERDLFRDKAQVSDSEIKAFYEERKDRFMDPEKTVLQYIAFPHKEKGEREKAITDLKESYEKFKNNPKAMEKTAKKLNLAIKETPPFSSNEIIPEIGEIKDLAAISARLRPMLDIVPVISEEETGISYIIRVKERIPPHRKLQKEVSAYIENILKDEKAKELAGKEAEKIYEDMKNNVSFEGMAKKYNLGIRQTDLISRFDYIEGAGESYKAVDAAMKLKIGEISKPIEARKGFIFIEPLEFEFMNEEKFGKEKENYKNRLLGLKKIKALQDWLAKAETGTSLAVNLDQI